MELSLQGANTEFTLGKVSPEEGWAGHMVMLVIWLWMFQGGKCTPLKKQPQFSKGWTMDWDFQFMSPLNPIRKRQGPTETGSSDHWVQTMSEGGFSKKFISCLRLSFHSGPLRNSQDEKIEFTALNKSLCQKNRALGTINGDAKASLLGLLFFLLFFALWQSLTVLLGLTWNSWAQVTLPRQSLECWV